MQRGADMMEGTVTEQQRISQPLPRYLLCHLGGGLSGV